MADAAAAPTQSQPRLKRALRLRDLTLFYIVTGLSVRWVATAAAAGPGTLLVWIFALVGFFLPLAASVFELSSRFPQEGGLYVWTREAFGDFAGFLTAWMYWMSNLPYFASVLYFGAGSLLFAAGARGRGLAASPAYFMSFAVVWLGVITVINIVGLDAGKWLNNVCSTGSWLPILILVILAGVSAARFGPATRFSAPAFAPHLSLKNAIFWSTIFFAFGGCETGSFMGEEIENPRRTIPRALLVGGAVLAVGYIAGTASLLVALPSAEVSGVDGFMRGVAHLCARLGIGWPLVVAMAALLALNAIGGAASFLSSTSRLPFVAGIDRYLPPVFGSIHRRFQTPWVAIGVYGLAGILVAALGQAGTTVRGAYDVLISMGIITFFIPYLFLFAAMARLQSRPAGPGIARVPGGRPVALALAAVGFCSTALTIVLSVIPADEEPNKPLAVAKVLLSTAALIAGGVAMFAIALYKRRVAAAAEGHFGG
ncbi:MAG TPA: APC family permease [Acidobacteriaceae bacterium]